MQYPNVTKRKMNSGQKSWYYATIWGGKKDYSLWSVSTAKYFVGSLCQWHMQISLFLLWALGPVETWHSWWKCKITSYAHDKKGLQTSSLYLCSIDCGHFCYSSLLVTTAYQKIWLVYKLSGNVHISNSVNANVQIFKYKQIKSVRRK